MMRETFLERLRETIGSAESDQTYLNGWAQLRSKRLLAAVAPASIENIGYNYSTTQLVRRTSAILQRAMRLAETQPLDSSTSDGSAVQRKFLSIWPTWKRGRGTGRVCCFRPRSTSLLDMQRILCASLGRSRSLLQPAS